MSGDAVDRIVAGFNEAVAHSAGEDVPGLRLHGPQSIDVPTIRGRTRLSQAAFSAGIGVTLPTLRNWEQGRRAPEGPTRVLLAMLDRNPQVVEQTLGTPA